MITGSKSITHPTKATKHPGVVRVIAGPTKFNPVYPPRASLNQMQAKAGIKKMATRQANSDPSVTYAVIR